MVEGRCIKCNKKLGMFIGQAEIKCPRCGTIVRINTQPNIKQSAMSATK